MSAMVDLIHAIDRYKHYEGFSDIHTRDQTGMSRHELGEDSKLKLAAIIVELKSEGLLPD